MATNILVKHETEVAEAIRTKKGTTAKINPQDFVPEILGINTFAVSNTERQQIVSGDTMTVFNSDEQGTVILTNVLADEDDEGVIHLYCDGDNNSLLCTLHGERASDVHGRYHIVVSKLKSPNVVVCMVVGEEYTDYPVETIDNVGYCYSNENTSAAVRISWQGSSSGSIHFTQYSGLTR